jgi:hypothetical protein
MNAEPLTCAPPGGRAAFSGTKALVFLPGAIVFGGLVGGAAAVAQSWFAPLIFFPLLVGVGLGAVLVFLLRFTQTAHRPTLLLGILLAVTTAALGQHYASYRAWMQRIEAHPQAAVARAAFADQLPGSFPAFLRWEAQRGRPLVAKVTARGPWAWVSWGVDGLLVLAGALAIVLPALAMPYCYQCESWYRTTRSGRLRQPTAQRLAAMFHLSLPERLRRIRYRLLSCEGGCQPMGLEFLWRRRRADGRVTVVWLTDHGRDAVQRVLDEARISRTPPKS